MQNNKIIIGTRSSKLAVWQANFIKSVIEQYFNDISIEIKYIKTKGDKILDTALDKIEGKGLFTKELENELIAGSIDIAIHSLKDLQIEIPEGLKLAAVTERHRVEDVLIAREKNFTISDLPKYAQVATGSMRRKAQLLFLRPDLQIHDLRGNVNTRIKKFTDSNWDAIVLAAAGVERLNLDSYISSYISTIDILPAVGQGAIGMEIHESNTFVGEILKTIEHKPTRKAVTAERSYLAALGGGCKTPIAGYAQIIDEQIILDGLVCSPDGKNIIREQAFGTMDSPEELGERLANILLNAGADEILNEIVSL
ncbi:MAG: hydroxymethylbilane synthase [Bacteroidota bacterium]|nr:hydroxymethylbilane synthase [Bacteroidota bacterium]